MIALAFAILALMVVATLTAIFSKDKVTQNFAMAADFTLLFFLLLVVLT